MNPEKIGKFICELRKEKNLSQYQLADMIPISRQGVSKWERGVTTPDTQTLITLSELFDVSIDELLRGERSENNTIEKLEETTLSILDQSNKKTKKIKRITIVSTIIISILLLLFLSYYFINSYNTTNVYTIYGQSKNFTTYDGIMIITKEKMYIKLGKLKNKNNLEIENIKLYYTKSNKKVKMVEDVEADNIVIRDSIGYYEKIKENNSKSLIKNIYLEITYKDNQKETIKLKFVRDFSNNNLFFKNQKTGKSQTEKETKEEIQPAEEKKVEETKPTIQETETKKEEPKQEQPKEENKPQEQQQEPQPTEPVITTEQIINKIKETGTFEDGTYTWGNSDYTIMIMYYEGTNKMEYYKNYNLIGTFDNERSITICTIDNCEAEINNIIKDYLFS